MMMSTQTPLPPQHPCSSLQAMRVVVVVVATVTVCFRPRQQQKQQKHQQAVSRMTAAVVLVVLSRPQRHNTIRMMSNKPLAQVVVVVGVLTAAA